MSVFGRASLVIAALALTLMAFTCEANAGVVCDLREEMVKNLAKWGEHVIMQGVIPGKNGLVTLELLASERGTFTILYTDRQGVSCMMVSGKDLEPYVEAIRT